jgi:hypothetical protein
MDGFENYTKIYKSEDGYYLAIKEGHDKNPEGLNLFLQNDWVKFKEMVDRYDKNKNKEPLGLGFYKDLSIQKEKTWELEMKDYFTFYFMKIAAGPNTWKGVEEITWQPHNTAGNFGHAFLNMEIKNNGTLIEANFNLNSSSNIKKTFTLYTAPIASKPPAILSTAKCPECPAQKSCPPTPVCPLQKACPTQKVCPAQKVCPFCPKKICPRCIQKTCPRCAKCTKCETIKKMVSPKRKPRRSWWLW